MQTLFLHKHHATWSSFATCASQQSWLSRMYCPIYMRLHMTFLDFSGNGDLSWPSLFLWPTGNFGWVRQGISARLSLSDAVLWHHLSTKLSKSLLRFFHMFCSSNIHAFQQCSSFNNTHQQMLNTCTVKVPTLLEVKCALVSMYRPNDDTPSRQIAYLNSNFDNGTLSTVLLLRQQLVNTIIKSKQSKPKMQWIWNNKY